MNRVREEYKVPRDVTVRSLRLEFIQVKYTPCCVEVLGRGMTLDDIDKGVGKAAPV